MMEKNDSAKKSANMSAKNLEKKQLMRQQII